MLLPPKVTALVVFASTATEPYPVPGLSSVDVSLAGGGLRDAPAKKPPVLLEESTRRMPATRLFTLLLLLLIWFGWP